MDPGCGITSWGNIFLWQPQPQKKTTQGNVGSLGADILTNQDNHAHRPTNSETSPRRLLGKRHYREHLWRRKKMTLAESSRLDATTHRQMEFTVQPTAMSQAQLQFEEACRRWRLGRPPQAPGILADGEAGVQSERSHDVTPQSRGILAAEEEKDQTDVVENGIENNGIYDRRLSRVVARADLSIRITDAVKFIRPFIACYVIPKIDLRGGKFREFIKIQTKLHAGICKKRTVATIATHDLRQIKQPLTYTALKPCEFKFMPLTCDPEIGPETFLASDWVQLLSEQAKSLRREKKRSVNSGIQQYVKLLKNLSYYAVLLDGDDEVISFPPLANSNKTKISEETTEIMLEVTSMESAVACEMVANTVVQAMEDLNLVIRGHPLRASLFSVACVDERNGQSKLDNQNHLPDVMESLRL